MAKRTSIIVEQVEVSIVRHDGLEYISLTDIAKKFGEARIVIQNWMRARNTIHFLGVWETLNNSNFNRIEFDALLAESGTNAFSMSPSRWVEQTNAKGMVTKMGRSSGGTYAHKDLALGFCYWVSPPFQLYLLQEFQRLKEKEAQEQKLSLDWDLKRTLAKINYTIHTDAVKNNLLPPIITDAYQTGIVYASEGDLLNVALFGMTAKDWKTANPTLKGNMRDYATAEQLLVMANLESLNAHLIKEGLPQYERLKKLNEVAMYQMSLLVGDKRLKG